MTMNTCETCKHWRYLRRIRIRGQKAPALGECVALQIREREMFADQKCDMWEEAEPLKF